MLATDRHAWTNRWRFIHPGEKALFVAGLLAADFALPAATVAPQVLSAAYLATVLGAEYGCSRPLVQKGWVPAERQIGQTGKTIRPKLYIAAGISGAIQHRVGVDGADMIVAINTDKNAPIFDFAHVGIVTDAIRLLPALTEAFRKRLSPHSKDRLAG